MTLTGKDAIKELVADLPLASELYWHLRRRKMPVREHYKLERIRKPFEEACAEVEPFVRAAKPGKRVFLFATHPLWIEQSAFLALMLAGLGHKVTLVTLPYIDWEKDVSKFDLRQRSYYTSSLFMPARRLFEHISMADISPASNLPAELKPGLEAVSTYDAQYIRQVEDVPEQDELYRMRLERNTRAAQAAYAWLSTHRPDTALIPNGTVFEFGAVYCVARHLRIPTVTFEFNDQHEQIWLAQNDEIMHQNTDSLWASLGGAALGREQLEAIQAFEQARMGARLEGRAARRWQDLPAAGSEQIRSALGLDSRPIVLLATNVLGDSLTLGRNVFSHSMAEWISRTVQYFAQRGDVQLVIRVHPGERLAHGPSMVSVVNEAASPLPEQVHLVGPLDKVNTYDLMSCARLGLVFTTTAGLEMALNGIPVIVAGKTHYRGKGFTLDPESWDAYFVTLDQSLGDLAEAQLTPAQVELAWRYAYHFFFSYPLPFPWRLISFWNDLKTWSLPRVLGPEGQREFGQTIACLTGAPLPW